MKWSRLKSREVLCRMNTGHHVQVHDDIPSFFVSSQEYCGNELKVKVMVLFGWGLWQWMNEWEKVYESEWTQQLQKRRLCLSIISQVITIHQWLCGNVMFCWVMFGFWHWMLFQHTKRSTIMTLTHTCPIFYQHFLSFPN